jgi:PAS domain S-box-containing protein
VPRIDIDTVKERLLRDGHRSTRTLFALFGIATVLPLLLVVVLPLQMATEALPSQGTTRVDDRSLMAADVVQLKLNAVGNLTDSFASGERVRGADVSTLGDPSNVARVEMRELRAANQDVRSVFMLDPAGRVMATEPWNDQFIGSDFSHRDYFEGALSSSSSYVSEAFIGASSGVKNVAVSRVVRNDDNTIRGVLVVGIDTERVFQSYVSRFNRDHGADLAVYDQRGQMVAGPGQPGALEASDDSHVREASASDGWSGTETINGTTHVSSYTPVDGTGWIVRASIVRGEAFAPVYRLRNAVVVTALVMCGAILLALAVLARSVRAREKSETRLRSSETRTRTILETARQMFCELDGAGRIRDWNTQAEVMLGWTREEVLGKDVVDVLIPENRRDHVRSLFQSMLRDGDSNPHSFQQVNQLQRKGTEEMLPAELSVWVTTVDGHRSINVFAQDVSDRLRLQKEQELVVKRQHALVEDLRAADKAKSDFLSTISHELRTPLTSITGYLEMLRDGYGGELSDNQQSMLDVVDRNSRRLLSLIEDVLTLSRIESGAFRMNRIDIDLRSALNSAVQVLVPSARNNDLEMHIDIAADIGTVTGDGDQLERVFLNLLSNAIKFTPGGGRVSVVAYRDERSVNVSVSDTGIGVPIEEQPRLFSRFFRASTAHAHAVQGTGLGLTIVKSIVERHGGSVSLQSAPGVGTTVYVELPVTQVETALSA